MTLSLGYTCVVTRGGPGDIPSAALHWTLEWTTKRGRSKNTWRRTQDLLSHLGDQSKAQAQNRQEWATFVAALHASRNNGHE